MDQKGTPEHHEESPRGSSEATPGPVQNAAPINATRWVYAIGRVVFAAVAPGVEAELGRAKARVKAEYPKLDDYGLTKKVLKDENPAYRYIAKKLTWSLSVRGTATCVLVPRHAEDTDYLLDTLRDEDHDDDLDIVIGEVVSNSSPDPYNPAGLPLVRVDQIIPLRKGELLKAFYRAAPPKGVKPDQRKHLMSVMSGVFDKICEWCGDGTSDADRARYFLATSDPYLYKYAAESTLRLNSVQVVSAPGQGGASVVTIVLTYADPETRLTHNYTVDVDVIGEFMDVRHRHEPSGR